MTEAALPARLGGPSRRLEGLVLLPSCLRSKVAGFVWSCLPLVFLASISIRGACAAGGPPGASSGGGSPGPSSAYTAALASFSPQRRSVVEELGKTVEGRGDLPSIMKFIREKSATADKSDLMAAVIFHGKTRGAPDIKPGVRGTLSTLYRAAAVLQIHDREFRELEADISKRLREAAAAHSLELESKKQRVQASRSRRQQQTLKQSSNLQTSGRSRARTKSFLELPQPPASVADSPGGSRGSSRLSTVSELGEISEVSESSPSTSTRWGRGSQGLSTLEGVSALFDTPDTLPVVVPKSNTNNSSGQVGRGSAAARHVNVDDSRSSLSQRFRQRSRESLSKAWSILRNNKKVVGGAVVIALAATGAVVAHKKMKNWRGLLGTKSFGWNVSSCQLKLNLNAAHQKRGMGSVASIDGVWANNTEGRLKVSYHERPAFVSSRGKDIWAWSKRVVSFGLSRASRTETFRIPGNCVASRSSSYSVREEGGSVALVLIDLDYRPGSFVVPRVVVATTEVEHLLDGVSEFDEDWTLYPGCLLRLTVKRELLAGPPIVLVDAVQRKVSLGNHALREKHYNVPADCLLDSSKNVKYMTFEKSTDQEKVVELLVLMDAGDRRDGWTALSKNPELTDDFSYLLTDSDEFSALTEDQEVVSAARV